MKKIGFIGAGNMGGAMAEACSKIGEVAIYDVNAKAYEHYKENKTITCSQSLEALLEECHYIVLSIKPQFYKEVCSKIKDKLKGNHIVITVAPSFTLSQMGQLLGEHVKLIRTMPNTPALIGQGMTAYCYKEDQVSREEVEEFKKYFESFGALLKVREELMPAVVATTGSSPAYGYLFIEAMADAAVSFGMPRDMAYEMAATAIKGACEMVLQTKQHPGALKDAVTSPAGTTIKAVLAMEEHGFRNSVIKGMEACYDQVIEMSKH